MDTSTKGAPRSKEFDDVYFSADDGLAETRHVFLQSNHLPARLNASQRFVIAETGFGTGLNFLAVWKLFEECAHEGESLHFISYEKYPLTATQISEYLQPWRSEFPALLDALIEKYPHDLQGEHFVTLGPAVSLQLIFDDVNAAIPVLQTPVDCWFLDGFKPSSNPDMWSDMLFTHMARLSKSNATFATFTAAGFVKRGLQAAGFQVEKIRGYGRKRDMLRGYFKEDKAS